jgi:hypothetical protein
MDFHRKSSSTNAFVTTYAAPHIKIMPTFYFPPTPPLRNIRQFIFLAEATKHLTQKYDYLTRSPLRMPQHIRKMCSRMQRYRPSPPGGESSRGTTGRQQAADNEQADKQTADSRQAGKTWERLPPFNPTNGVLEGQKLTTLLGNW